MNIHDFTILLKIFKNIWISTIQWLKNIELKYYSEIRENYFINSVKNFA